MVKPEGTLEGVSKGLGGSVQAAECADAPSVHISRVPGKPCGGLSGGLSYKREPVYLWRTGYQG